MKRKNRLTKEEKIFILIGKATIFTIFNIGIIALGYAMLLCGTTY